MHAVLCFVRSVKVIVCQVRVYRKRLNITELELITTTLPVVVAAALKVPKTLSRTTKVETIALPIHC